MLPTYDNKKEIMEVWGKEITQEVSDTVFAVFVKSQRVWKVFTLSNKWREACTLNNLDMILE